MRSLDPLLAARMGGYFPGLFTSFAYLIVGPILFMRLWEVRKSADSPITQTGKTNHPSA